MQRLIGSEIEKAVRNIQIGLSPRYLVCAIFEPGAIRVEVLPERCARAKEVRKFQPHRIVGCYQSGDARRVRRDLKLRANPERRTA